MNLSLINPYIRLAMESRIPAGHNIARRVIYDYELIYLEEGNFTFVYNGEAYYCKTGDIFFICPGIAHSFYLDYGEISQPHIHFDITHMSDSRQIPVCFKDLKDIGSEERKNIREDIFRKYPQKPFVVFSDQKAALETFYAIVNNQKPSSLTQKGLLVQLIDMIITDNFPELFGDNFEFVYSIEEHNLRNAREFGK